MSKQSWVLFVLLGVFAFGQYIRAVYVRNHPPAVVHVLATPAAAPCAAGSASPRPNAAATASASASCAPSP